MIGRLKAIGHCRAANGRSSDAAKGAPSTFGTHRSDGTGSSSSAVMTAAAAAKVALSDCQSAIIGVPSDGSGVSVTLSRTQMEALVQPLLTRIWEAMQRAGTAVFLEWTGRCDTETLRPCNGRGGVTESQSFVTKQNILKQPDNAKIVTRKK